MKLFLYYTQISFYILIPCFWKSISYLAAQSFSEIKFSNYCVTTPSTLTIEGFSRGITSNETNLVKQLAKIEVALKKEGYEENKTDISSSPKIQSLCKKKSSIELKQQLIYKSNERISVEVLTFSLVFCKKILKTKETEFSYWGIKEVILPTIRKGTEPGAISIAYDTLLTTTPFNDTLNITFKIKRNAFKEIPEKEISTDLKIVLQSNKEDDKDVKLSILPLSEKDFLGKLFHAEGDFGLHYIADLESFTKNIQQILTNHIK